MGPKDPILIVCHAFPPFKGIGGRRWAKFGKELATRGHAVHVIACRPDPDEIGSQWTRDAGAPGIIVHRLPRHYPKVMYERPLTRLIDKVAYRSWKTVLPWFTRGNHFDKTIFWRGQLLRAASRLIREHGIRDVIVSGAPFRLLAHMAALRRELPIQLIAELRDPWTWKAGYGWELLSQRQQREERAIEAAALHAADKILVPSESFLTHLRHTYPDLAGRTVHLPHAVDPEDLPKIPPSSRGQGGLRAIIAGSFYDRPQTRDFLSELARAVVRIERLAGAGRRSLSIDIHPTTPPPAEFIEAIRDNGAQELIHFLPPLPSEELYARLQGADLAISFHPPARRDLVATKFSEYLLLGVPLLYVSEPGTASRFIEAHGGGHCVGVDGLAKALDALATGSMQLSRPDPLMARSFLLGELTTRLEREVLVQPPTDAISSRT